MVGRLVKEFAKQPEKEQKRKAKVQQAQQVQEAVKRAVAEHTGTNTPIMSSAQLVDRVLDDSAVDVNARQVRRVLKQDLGFSYR